MRVVSRWGNNWRPPRRGTTQRRERPSARGHLRQCQETPNPSSEPGTQGPTGGTILGCSYYMHLRWKLPRAFPFHLPCCWRSDEQRTSSPFPRVVSKRKGGEGQGGPCDGVPLLFGSRVQGTGAESEEAARKARGKHDMSGKKKAWFSARRGRPDFAAERKRRYFGATRRPDHSLAQNPDFRRSSNITCYQAYNEPERIREERESRKGCGERA